MRYKIRESTVDDDLVSIWRSSVADTHSFVSRADLVAIDLEVRRFLPGSSVWLALGGSDEPIGFMGLNDDRIESLFIAGQQQGRGAGRALIEFAMQKSSTLTTVVNEQNEAAVGFYRHLGFVVVGRLPDDEEGRPYPVLHLNLKHS